MANMKRKVRRGKGAIDGKDEGKGLKEGEDEGNLLLAGGGDTLNQTLFACRRMWGEGGYGS
jgi:hypothetical protein